MEITHSEPEIAAKVIALEPHASQTQGWGTQNSKSMAGPPAAAEQFSLDAIGDDGVSVGLDFNRNGRPQAAALHNLAAYPCISSKLTYF